MRWWDAIALIAAALSLAGSFLTGWHLATRRARHLIRHRLHHERHRTPAPVDPAYAQEADWPKPLPLCGCERTCGDDGDVDGPGTCKGLPAPRPTPLVEIVLVDRHLRTAPPSSASQTPAGNPEPRDQGR